MMNSSAEMDKLRAAASLEIQSSNLVTEKKPPPDAAASIPNGGLTAWLQVVGAFFVFLNSRGIVNTYGVFQSYYETNILSSQTSSNISWIGSIQAFLLLIVGILTGPIYDAGFFRTLIMNRSFLVVFGMIMTLSSLRRR